MRGLHGSWIVIFHEFRVTSPDFKLILFRSNLEQFESQLSVRFVKKLLLDTLSFSKSAQFAHLWVDLQVLQSILKLLGRIFVLVLHLYAPKKILHKVSKMYYDGKSIGILRENDRYLIITYSDSWISKTERTFPKSARNLFRLSKYKTASHGKVTHQIAGSLASAGLIPSLTWCSRAESCVEFVSTRGICAVYYLLATTRDYLLSVTASIYVFSDDEMIFCGLVSSKIVSSSELTEFLYRRS